MNEILDNIEKKIKITIHVLHEKLSAIVVLGASPSILKNIKIDYYGSPTPINQVANISASDASMLLIKPFDQKINKQIVEAINKANIGLNPIDDVNLIRISIPPTTAEKRQSFVKEVKQIGEQTRIAIRNLRIDSNKKIKSEKISDDEKKQLEIDVQKLIDKVNLEIEDIINKKIEVLTKM